jgi:flagellar basal body rod protein FlgG
MINGMASAISGIQTGGKMLHAGAHNIANAQTEGFKQTRAFPVEISIGSVTVTLEKDERPGPYLFSQEDPYIHREGSNVDLGDELIAALQAVNLIEVNIASFRIQKKVLGSLLEITE